MNRLFLHHPVFRLLSPLFSGILIYLLILLINNNVEQLETSFITLELLFCVVLSYLIQEGSRFILLKLTNPTDIDLSTRSVFLKVITLLLLAFCVVTLSIIIYYQHILKYSPSSDELIMFNSIFGTVSLIYILLFISHDYLIKTHQIKLTQEKQNKELLESEFQHFRSGINPDLLFDSFNALIDFVHSDRKKADQLIDRLATVYRYILAPKVNELVDASIEFAPLVQLVALLSELPFRSIRLNIDQSIRSKVIPGTLLNVLEKIIRSTIPSQTQAMMIEIKDDMEYMIISYKPSEKVNMPIDDKSLKDIMDSYAVYSAVPMYVRTNGMYRQIGIPKINL